jgi:chromosome condensin MukBEF ATPase and DNA-binding subunit MukB
MFIPSIASGAIEAMFKEIEMYVIAAVAVVLLVLSGALWYSRHQLEGARQEIADLKAEKAQDLLTLKATQARAFTLEQAVNAYRSAGEMEKARAKEAVENARKAREEFQAIVARLTLNPPPSDPAGALEWAFSEAGAIQGAVK